MNKSSESYKVYLEKSEAAKSGATSQTPEVDGQSYPGRPLPKSEVVKEAKDEPGTAVRLQRDQTGLNRYPINQHVEKQKGHGPNN
jgi:hypothetical protein